MSHLDRALTELRDALARGEVTSSVLVDEALSRIDQLASLNAFTFVDQDGARAAAKASDQRRGAGHPLSPLDGIPIALKDNFVTKSMPTTAGSKILEGFSSPYEAGATRRLREAGAIIVGKTNMDEFAMGSSSEHSCFGPVKNPWNPKKVPGGSSGGSAVAVAARMVPGAYGTDTGGSIRQPAALCGVYGLKPSYGRVSRAGIVAFASSLDQVGPFANTPDDLALLLGAVAGFDDHDSTSAQVPVPDYSATSASLEGIRVGIPEEFFAEGVDPEVESRVREGIRALERRGATTQAVSLPHTRYALSVYYLLCTAEASSNLARYDGVRYGRRVEDGALSRMIVQSRFEGFGEEVRRRIVLGTFVLSHGYYDAYYAKAQRVRTLIRRDFEQVFEQVDLLATPTSPITAFDLGARIDDPLSMYMADVCTLSVNLAGVPALSAPVGASSEGLPVGLQLIAPWFEESRLLQGARALAAEGFRAAAPETSGA